MDEIVSDSEDQVSQLAPLANFLTDYEYLKQVSGLTQKEIAERSATSQSAVSRLENMRGLPAYDLLVRISKAVGGELIVSPMGKYTFTIPYDIQERVRKIAENEGIPLLVWLNREIRRGLGSSNKTAFVQVRQEDWRLKRVSGGDHIRVSSGARFKLGTFGKAITAQEWVQQ